ncbi:MAG: stage II sporulation protein P [Defluviitaleaceae bacterium]|nr:stage II sporulation protein P [Defluviitaleaceae bacterium]MCL2275683.1 stage II sporulation protein P [Defluviitaleaceae bacterium]
MKTTAKTLARQRMVLGGLLIVSVVLFMWTRTHAAGQNGAPRFGYDVNYALPGVDERVDETHHYEPLPLPYIDPDYIFTRIQDAMLFPPAQTPPGTSYNDRPYIPMAYIEAMDFQYIRTHLFLEDPSTLLLESDIDPIAFFNADLTIDPSAPGPHVLIFHTHSTEWFIDTNPSDPMTGIIGVGRYLAEVLSEQFGLEVLHYTGRFDVVNGRPQIMGSYERMEPVITALLAENPQIQLVIDLHRDGVRTGVGPFTRIVNGKPTARIMFFNGLTRRNVNGEAVPTAWLHNPYLQENLQFSFQAQLAANARFPGFNRRVYLRAYRFSTHMHPRSIFVEVGNQYNTLQEAKNAMHPLALILSDVLLKE